MNRALIAMALFAALLAAWMFRYDVSGHVGFGDGAARPILLDRWTGKTYIYYQVAAEKQFVGGWAETKAVRDNEPDGPWMDSQKR